MTQVEQLREQYRLQMESAPAEMRMLFQGIMMGIDLCRGAAAVDFAAELKELVAKLPADSGSEPTWRRRPSGTGTRVRNPDTLVQIYGLTDPRHEEEQIFYVGSAMDPEGQLQDYIRTEGVGVSCKAIIEELIAIGKRPGITVLEKDIRLGDAGAKKAEWINRLVDEGHELTNQRR